MIRSPNRKTRNIWARSPRRQNESEIMAPFDDFWINRHASVQSSNPSRPQSRVQSPLNQTNTTATTGNNNNNNNNNYSNSDNTTHGNNHLGHQENQENQENRRNFCSNSNNNNMKNHVNNVRNNNVRVNKLDSREFQDLVVQEADLALANRDEMDCETDEQQGVDNANQMQFANNRLQTNVNLDGRVVPTSATTVRVEPPPPKGADAPTDERDRRDAKYEKYEKYGKYFKENGKIDEEMMKRKTEYENLGLAGFESSLGRGGRGGGRDRDVAYVTGAEYSAHSNYSMVEDSDGYIGYSFDDTDHGYYDTYEAPSTMADTNENVEQNSFLGETGFSQFFSTSANAIPAGQSGHGGINHGSTGSIGSRGGAITDSGIVDGGLAVVETVGKSIVNGNVNVNENGNANVNRKVNANENEDDEEEEENENKNEENVSQRAYVPSVPAFPPVSNYHTNENSNVTSENESLKENEIQNLWDAERLRFSILL